MHVYTNTYMHTRTVDEKEAMDLKESEWCMGGLRKGKGKREMLQSKCNLKSK